MTNHIQHFIRLVLLAACCSLPQTTWVVAQDGPPPPAEANSPPASVSQSDDEKTKTFVEEIEPGVRVLGVASRFAEIGTSSSFDSSPDGRHLVFASSGKIKFFDLVKNKVTDTIGEAKENYQHVRYSADGRYVFAGGRRSNDCIVRVFDAIDKSSTGTITAKVESDDEKNQHVLFNINSLLVSADATYVGLCSHDSLQVREVKTGDLVYHAKNLGYVQGACFSPDEKNLILPQHNKLVVVDIESGKQLKKSDFPFIGQQCYSVSDNIATNSLAIPMSGSVSIYELGEDTREPTIIKLPSQHYAQQATFSDDGKMLATLTWSERQMTLLIIDIEQNKVVKTIANGSNGQGQYRFSGDNQLLFVSGSGINGVKEISLANLSAANALDNETQPSSSQEHPSGPATNIVMHPDEKAFLTVTQGGKISWFDIATGGVDLSVSGSNVSSIQINASGSEVLAASRYGDKSATTYSFETGKPKQNYSMSKTVKKKSVFSRFGRFMGGANSTHTHRQQSNLGSSYSQDTTEIVSLGLTHVNTWEAESSGIFGSNYSSSQQKIYLSAFKFDATTGERESSKPIPSERFGFGEHDWPSTSAPSPRGDQFAIANQSKLFLVETESGETISESELDSESKSRRNYIHKIRYSPDGRLLAVQIDNEIGVVDVDSGKEIQRFLKKSLFASSQDGKRLAVASTNKKSPIEILDTKSWKPVLTREETQGKRTSLALSKNGQKVLIGLSDCRVELWDLKQFLK